jgi:UDP-N-acetylmuramoylalanine--D-glutamate ligase
VALGAPDQEIACAQASFKPLEHRVEPCGTVSGVACYNDSKATNTDATVKALQAFPGKRLVIMLGGDDKGTDLAELVKEVYAHAAVAVCFGAAAERFMQALEQDAPADVDASQLVRVHAGNMEDALDKALAQAHSGDVVLLSPACASFDEFTSFEQRGEVFKKLVSVRAEACAQACAQARTQAYAQACTQAYAQACATTNNQIDARKTDKEA